LFFFDAKAAKDAISLGVLGVLGVDFFEEPRKRGNQEILIRAWSRISWSPSFLGSSEKHSFLRQRALRTSPHL